MVSGPAATTTAQEVTEAPTPAELQLSKPPSGTAPRVLRFPFDKVNKNPYNIPNRNRKRDGTRTVMQLLDNAVGQLQFCGWLGGCSRRGLSD